MWKAIRRFVSSLFGCMSRGLREENPAPSAALPTQTAIFNLNIFQQESPRDLRKAGMEGEVSYLPLFNSFGKELYASPEPEKGFSVAREPRKMQRHNGVSNFSQRSDC